MRRYEEGNIAINAAIEQVLAADSLPATFSSIEVMWGKEPLKSGVSHHEAGFATTHENIVEVVYAPPCHWPSKVEPSWCR